MKTVMICGQNHKGSTYHIARMLAEKIGGEITEFFLPRDFGAFCTGCTACFTQGESYCPHYAALLPITQAIDEADVIILASPVYVFHASGAMKALLDHYGWRWMSHRPDAAMFRKQGVCVSTAAGAGMRSANRDMADSLFYWGVAGVYRYGLAVAATDWDGADEKKKRAAEKAADALAAKIVRRHGRIKPSLKTKGFFYIMHLMQKNGWNEKDVRYWQEMGWIGRARPWKE